MQDVLVADASRRTRKVNAYVSGIGATRRVVLYDTLLGEVPQAELEVVVAHELGPPARRHVAKGTALAMLGAASATLVVWALLADPQDPAVAPMILLISAVLELLALPFETALSRRWERVADRFSLDADRRPRRLSGACTASSRSRTSATSTRRGSLYLLLFSHPTAPERIASRPERGAGSRERPVLQSRPMPNIGPMELILLGVARGSHLRPGQAPRDRPARSGAATREFKDSVTGTGIRRRSRASTTCAAR